MGFILIGRDKQCPLKICFRKQKDLTDLRVRLHLKLRGVVNGVDDFLSFHSDAIRTVAAY